MMFLFHDPLAESVKKAVRLERKDGNPPTGKEGTVEPSEVREDVPI